MLKNKQNNQSIDSHTTRIYIIRLALFTLAGLLLLWFIPPIPQWAGYHAFADRRMFLGIPGFCNVTSNALFVLTGVLGFISLRRKFARAEFIQWQEAIPFVAAFAGLILTGIGSAYYHWSPDNASLIWDRLPMTLVFTSTIAIVWMERVDFHSGLRLLLPFILMGAGSVIYWAWTESQGMGDLRLYGFVQFYSLLLLLVLLYLFPKPKATLPAYLGMVFFYILAKGFEYADTAVYKMGGWVSGHTLKHIAAAASAWCLVVLLKRIRFRL